MEQPNITELELFKRLYAFMCTSMSTTLTNLEAGDAKGAAFSLRYALRTAEEFYMDSIDDLDTYEKPC